MNQLKILLLFTFVAIGAFLFTSNLLDKQENHLVTKIKKSKYYQEYAELNRKLKHYSSNSTDALRISERINKIERKVLGERKSDQPDEFARILSEMKIPYEADVSSYPINYKFEELEKSAQRTKSLNKSSSILPWQERVIMMPALLKRTIMET